MRHRANAAPGRRPAPPAARRGLRRQGQRRIADFLGRTRRDLAPSAAAINCARGKSPSGLLHRSLRQSPRSSRPATDRRRFHRPRSGRRARSAGRRTGFPRRKRDRRPISQMRVVKSRSCSSGASTPSPSKATWRRNQKRFGSQRRLRPRAGRQRIGPLRDVAGARATRHNRPACEFADDIGQIVRLGSAKPRDGRAP